MELTGLRTVVLDTSAAVYFLDRPPTDPRCAAVLPFVRAAEDGGLDLVASAVTATELLTKPIRDGNRRAETAARLLLDLCRLAPVDFAVAERAASLRARHRLRTPDALICATALVHRADALLANDLRWKHVDEVAYLHVDDLAGG